MTSYLTPLAYARLALADVLESRFIWLDADTLLLSGWQGIGELPTLPAGIVARACPELPEFLQASTRNEARIRAGTQYFNSGVIEFDPELWRELGLHRERPLLIQQYNTHHFEYHDQDILNFLLVGKTVELPDQFNFQQPFRTQPSVQPKILHYCGELKPWKTRGVERTRAFCAVSSTPFHWYHKFWMAEKVLLNAALHHSAELHSELEILRRNAQRNDRGALSRIKRKIRSTLRGKDG